MKGLVRSVIAGGVTIALAISPQAGGAAAAAPLDSSASQFAQNFLREVSGHHKLAASDVDVEEHGWTARLAHGPEQASLFVTQTGAADVSVQLTTASGKQLLRVRSIADDAAGTVTVVAAGADESSTLTRTMPMAAGCTITFPTDDCPEKVAADLIAAAACTVLGFIPWWRPAEKALAAAICLTLVVAAKAIECTPITVPVPCPDPEEIDRETRKLQNATEQNREEVEEEACHRAPPAC